MSRRSAGAAVSYAYSAAQVVISLLYVPLLLGAIGRSEYGLYQMVGAIMAYMGIMNTTLSAGASRYYCKYFAMGDEDGMANVLGTLKRLYRKANVIVVVVIAVVAVAVRFVYAESLTAWELTESTILLAILGVNMLFTINNTLSIAVITAHERFTFLKGSQLVMLLVQPLLILLLVQGAPYAWVVCAVQLLCNAVCRTVQQMYAKRKLGMDDRLREYSKDLEGDLLKFSGGIVLAAIADQIFWRVDQLIIGWMYGTKIVSLYAVGSQIITAYAPLGTTIASVFLPKASEIWNREQAMDGLSDLFVRVGRLSLYPMLLVLTGFAIFGLDFMVVWAGPDFTQSFWVAFIVMVPFTIDISQNIGLTILQVRNMYAFRGWMYFASAIANVALTFPLAWQFGCIGAACSSAVAMFFCSGIVMNWYFWKRVGLDVPRFWKSVLRMVLPLALLCVAGVLVWQNLPHAVSWPVLAAGIAVYTILFCAVAWFCSTNEYEKNLIRGFLHRK